MKKGKILPKRKGIDILAEKLEEIRTERDLNQAEFCDVLKESDRNYRGWVKGKPDHDTEGKPIRVRTEPSIDKLLSIADKLGVSLDYLFGRSQYQTVDNDLIGEVTGLNDEAINTLRALAYVDIKHKERYMTVVNHFLSSDNIELLMGAIRFFVEYALPFMYSVPVMTDSKGNWKKIDNSKTRIALAMTDKHLSENNELDLELIPSLAQARAEDMMMRYVKDIAQGYVKYAISQGFIDESYIRDNAETILKNLFNNRTNNK